MSFWKRHVDLCFRCFSPLALIAGFWAWGSGGVGRALIGLFTVFASAGMWVRASGTKSHFLLDVCVHGFAQSPLGGKTLVGQG